MRRAFLALALAATPLAAQHRPAGPVTEAAGFDLDAYRWRSRVLVLLAPSAADEGYARQRAALDEEAAGLRARDMVVVTAFAGSGEVDGRPLGAAAAARLRRRLDAPAGGLAVVLVGKDGGVKLRRAAPVAPGELFALVDRMPMGRAEAERRGREP